MKYVRFISFITGIILLGYSCNQGSIELRGKVLDEKTKTAIPGRRIIIHALIEEGNNFSSVYIGEFCTDSSGQFEYFLKRDNDFYLYNFSLVGDSSYASANKRLGLTELIQYGKFLTFNLDKLTDLKIAIESKSKTCPDEILYVTWMSDGRNGKEIYPYTIKNYGIRDPGNSAKMPLKWVGSNVKSAINTKVYADKETIVRWELHTYWDVKKLSDTIFCKRDVFNCVYFNY